MDDSTGTTAAVKVLGAGAGVLVAALLARAVAGDLGVTVVLLVALVVVARFAYEQLTGRALPRAGQLTAGRARRAPVAPAVDDAWHSERWIRDAVERGLRSLEDWRIEQREA